MSFSAIRWMNENSGEFFPTLTPRLYEEKGQIKKETYYTHLIDVDSLANQFANLESAQKMDAVLAIDSKTGENALHYLLNNKIYKNATDSLITILPKEVKLIWNQNYDYLFKFKLFCSCDCEISKIDKENYKQFLSSSGKTELELQKAILKSQNEHQALTAAERATYQSQALTTYLIGLLDDPILFRALSEENKSKQLPLHCAYQSNNKSTFWPLLLRIKNFSLTEKRYLVLKQDSKGKNLFHYMIQWNHIMRHYNVFGLQVMREALEKVDEDNNNPLHELLRFKYPLERFRFIRQLNFSEEEINDRETRIPADILFRQNSGGENPLHLVCQNAEEKEGAEILIEMRVILGGDLFFKKIQEKDIDHCNVLLIAIQANHLDKVRILLNDLTAEQRIKLILAEDKNKYHALHYACLYGNLEILKIIMNTLGSRKVFNISMQSNLNKLVARNKNILPEERSLHVQQIFGHTVLFAGYRYLATPRKATSEHSACIDHMGKSLVALQDKKKILHADKRFSSSLYDSIVHHLKYVNETPSQLGEFKELLEEDRSKQLPVALTLCRWLRSSTINNSNNVESLTSQTSSMEIKQR